MLTLSLPAVYTLELTPSCNNRCPACSSSANHRHQRRRSLSAEQWGAWLETFGHRAARIRLSGGEPTSHPEFARILEMACAYDARVSVFTNGRWRNTDVLLNHLKVQQNLAGLLVSLHGARPETHEAFTGVPGSFQQVVINVRRAREAGIAVALSVVISAYNWQEMEQIAALRGVLDAEHVAFNRYIGPDSWPGALSEEQTAQTVEQIERLIAAGERVLYSNCFPQCFSVNQSEGCMAGVTWATIDPWGGVRPCIYSPTLLGSLQHNSLSEIWNGEALHRWRSWEPENCAGCAAYPACHGGCRAAAEHHRAAQDPLIRERFEAFEEIHPLDDLPLEGRPHHHLKLVPESFGYLLISGGEVAPVRKEAYDVLMACNGERSVAELREEFSITEMDLIRELWNLGMIDVT